MRSGPQGRRDVPPPAPERGEVIGADDVRQALRRQWGRIADACEGLDGDRASRVAGWRNVEVLAHVTVQPLLLGRFLADADTDPADMRLEDNLAGTHSLADAIDTAARDSASAGRTEFARAVSRVDAALAGADLDATVTTIQGRLRLIDYLRTRCIEAVVHGHDLQPPVEADPVAHAVAVDALLAMLHDRPDALAAAQALPAQAFLDSATGRGPTAPGLEHVMPLMR